MTKTKPLITLTELYERYRASISHKGIMTAGHLENLDTLLGQALLLPENEQLQFFLPELEQWGIFASSLLKFAFPPSQISHTYRRFAIQWLANSRVTKKHIHKLSWPALEWLIQQLCNLAFSTSIQDLDVRLQLWWIHLDVREFQVKRLVEGDIHLFSQEDPSRLHSYYYQGQLDEKTLTHILKAHGFSETTTGANLGWLKDSQKETPDEKALVLAYWLVRRLAFPLPWSTLLSVFQKNASLWGTLADNQPLLQAMAAEIEKETVGTDNAYSENQKKISLGSDYWSIVARLDSACSQSDKTAAEKNLLSVDRPYQRLILVEGTTEAILLPLFAELYCLRQSAQYSGKQGVEAETDWDAVLDHVLHTVVMPVGGKNQMFAMYRTLANDLGIPIGILLDRDAAKTYQHLEAIKRDVDPLLMIEEGEMEDLYTLDLILPVINGYYHPHPVLTASLYQEIIDLSHPLLSSFPGVQKPKNRVEELRLIWQVFSFGRFDKVYLAQQIAASLSEKQQAEDFELSSSLLPSGMTHYIRQLYGLP